jgi:hypothetical protein
MTTLCACSRSRRCRTRVRRRRINRSRSSIGGETSGPLGSEIYRRVNGNVEQDMKFTRHQGSSLVVTVRVGGYENTILVPAAPKIGTPAPAALNPYHETSQSRCSLSAQVA